MGKEPHRSLGGGQLGGPAVGLGCFPGEAGLFQQGRTGGVQQVVAVQLRGHCVDELQRHGRAVDLGNRDGTVEGHDGCRHDHGQPVVQPRDRPPVGVGEGGGSAVDALDGRLQLKRPQPASAEATEDQVVAFRDQRSVPLRAVLVAEQHHVVTAACRRPGLAEQHQGEQADRLGLIGHERHKQPSQPDRLPSQVPPLSWSSTPAL